MEAIDVVVTTQKVEQQKHPRVKGRVPKTAAAKREKGLGEGWYLSAST